MVTGEQVKEAAKNAGITHIDHHDCALCGEMVFYCVEGDDLYFNSGCGCSWAPPRPASWQQAADWINMQSEDKHRIGVAKRFGLDLTPAEARR